ncbi:MAG: lantibiotic dehydratase [Janthinobacterium lividum]
MSYKIEFHNFIVLRTPLLPFAAAQHLSEEALRELFRSPVLSEAIFIASPELSQAVQGWLTQPARTKKEGDKLLLTLRKYLLRMAYRCTPYGLFAGISRAEWGAATTLELVPQPQYVRHSRVDMDYLCTLATALAQDAVVREQVRYYPNNTLYPVGDQYRYIEYSFREKVRQHDLVTVERSEYLAFILQQAQAGLPAAALAESLVSEDISREEAQDFLEEIIASQVLVSELEPAVTGPEYLQQLQQVLQARCAQHPVLTHLTELTQRLAALDAAFAGNTLASYQELLTAVGQQGVVFEANHLLQVDLLKPLRGRALNAAVQAELSKAIQLLYGLGNQREDERLSKFRAAFREQYEQQQVPLLQALDMEMGIGYPVDQQASTDPAPLLQDLFLGSKAPEEANQKWTAWQEFLFEKYLRVINGQDAHILLQAEEVKPFITESTKPLPASLYCMGSVLASSAQALDEGEFQVEHYVTAGPSAATLLGRFCHLDAGLTADVRVALRQEEAQYPEAVFAEIVHLNQSRIGNISTRPVLRAYEIPILGQAGVDEEHVIPLSDLFLSVEGDTLILRSARLNRRVIPRLSSAHNFALHALPVYHFLCALQSQGVHSLVSWHWGLLRQAKFLPRVTYGKTILARAQWRLSKSEIDQISQAQDASLLGVVHQLRQARGLPAWVVIAEGDNKLPIWLDSQPHLQVLQAALKRQTTIVVEECLLQPNNLLVEGPEGGFTNEFIFPLSVEFPTSVPATTIGKKQMAPAPARTFSLGSEWLYVKLYCGLQTADRLLVDVMLPLAQQLKQQGIIDTWFFIRYRDTHHHLRIRFHGTGTFYSQVIEKMHAALLPYEQANLVSSLRTDTYRREIERYGAQNITLTEGLFQHDSEATLQALALLGGQESDKVRWLLALHSVDAMLTDFERTPEEKLRLMDSMQQGFKVELESTSAAARKTFGTKYRQVRAQIEEVLSLPLPEDNDLAPAAAIFAERSRQWAPLVQAVLQQEIEGTLEIKLDNLLASYAHMSLNRFFRSKQRMQEAVVYDFLHQYYSSAVARAASSCHRAAGA